MKYSVTDSSTVTTGLPAQQARSHYSQQVLNEVSVAFGVPAEFITARTKRREVVQARWMYWQILYSQMYTLAACGRLAGGHDHTAVMHCLAKVKQEIVMNPVMRAGYQQVRHLVAAKERAEIEKMIVEFDNR